MNLILTPLRAEAGIVLTHVRGVRPVSCRRMPRCWLGRGPDGTRVAIGCVGWGARRAGDGASALANRFNPERIVAWGMAGALSQKLKPGDLVLCHRIVDGNTGEPLTRPGGVPPTIEFAGPGRCSVARASDLTWPRPVLRRSTRCRLAERFNCELVEMENAALGRAALDADAEFLPLRSILDGVTFPRLPGARELDFMRSSLHAGAGAAVQAAEC